MKEELFNIESFAGIDIHYLKTDKFKTNSISFFFLDRLSIDNAAVNALIPAVLRRGSEAFPTLRSLSRYLEKLYGATFDCGVIKKGEVQIIHFYLEFISEKYAKEMGSLFEKCLNLMLGIVTRPLLDKGSFRSDYLEQEKENLKNLILSRQNDKVTYSIDKCMEEMCKGEPFSIYEYGRLEDMDNIDPQRLYSRYQEMLARYPLKVYLTGQLDEATLYNTVRTLKYDFERKFMPFDISVSITHPPIKALKNVNEKMEINQGKLTMGFRTNVSPSSKEYYSLLVYNGILGGGIHSKLFQNVREKEGLAYYSFSRLEKFKGLMIISSGIEPSNKERVEEIVRRQILDMKEGIITSFEFDATLKTIETGIKSLKDSHVNIIDFFLGQSICSSRDDFEALLSEIKKVKFKNVVETAAGIELDTVYFLAP